MGSKKLDKPLVVGMPLYRCVEDNTVKHGVSLQKAIVTEIAEYGEVAYLEVVGSGEKEHVYLSFGVLQNNEEFVCMNGFWCETQSRAHKWRHIFRQAKWADKVMMEYFTGLWPTEKLKVFKACVVAFDRSYGPIDYDQAMNGFTHTYANSNFVDGEYKILSEPEPHDLRSDPHLSD